MAGSEVSHPNTSSETLHVPTLQGLWKTIAKSCTNKSNAQFIKSPIENGQSFMIFFSFYLPLFPTLALSMLAVLVWSNGPAPSSSP
jgi:hypothetical protein